MSREIKFRAWADYGDGSGEMLPNVQNHINGDWAFGNILMNNVEGKNFTVMQFTGMLDKNGVEIYEGDILSEPISPVGGKNGAYLYESRVIKWLGASRGYGLYAPYAASEIIGNIHQNPELLK